MRVRASTNSDYIFNPAYGELTDYRRKFGLSSLQVGEGFTLSTYSDMTSVLIKDRAYLINGFEYFTELTQSFDNVTQAMQMLNLTVSVDSGILLDNTRGLINFKSSALEYTTLGFVLIGIPQIHGIYTLNGGDKMVIIGVDGEYNFRTELFHGALDLIDYADFLESKK